MNPGWNYSCFSSNQSWLNHHSSSSYWFAEFSEPSNPVNIISNYGNYRFDNLLPRMVEQHNHHYHQELHQYNHSAENYPEAGLSYAPVPSTVALNFAEQRQEIIPMPQSIVPLPSFESLVNFVRNGNPGGSFSYNNVHQQLQTLIRSNFSMVNNVSITEIQSTVSQSCTTHDRQTLAQRSEHRQIFPRQNWNRIPQQLQTDGKVICNHQTNELALWPCLRNLSLEDLCNIKKFYVVDNGFSMFILTRHGGVFLYKNGSNYGQQIFTLQNTELILFQSISSQYVHFMSNDRKLWVWSNASNKTMMLGISNPQKGINLVMANVLKFRSNQNHCLALSGQHQLYVWGLIVDKENKEYPSSEDLIDEQLFRVISSPACLNPYFVKPDNPKIIDFDCGVYGSVILLRSNDDHNNDGLVYIYCFGNWKQSFIPMLTKIVRAQIYRVVAGKRIFLLLAKDGSVYQFNQGRLMKLSIDRQITSAICIPSTDAFLLLDSANGHRYLWNYMNDEKLMPTHTNSTPDLLSLYGCYPSTLRWSTIDPNCLEAGYIARLRAFNNPFHSNFQIKFSIDPDSLPATIYAKREDLIRASAYYRNLLQKQFPTIDETIECDYRFIDYYYFFKKQFVGLDLEPILGKDIHGYIAEIGNKESSWKLYKILEKIDEDKRTKKPRIDFD